MRIRRWLLLGTFFMLFGLIGSAAESPVSTPYSPRPWNDYRTIMWIGDTVYRSPEKLPLFFRRLQEMGVNTAMIYGDSAPDTVVTNGFPYYVENMVNRGLCLKFNSRVTDWDKFVTEWARNGRRQSGLIRDYCLDDPAWVQTAKETVTRIVSRNRSNHPLMYNIRDELSTTISANPFDYDYNPITLEHFRVWLKSIYGSLQNLNTEWDTRFGAWQDVIPFTTDQIKNRMATGASFSGQPDWQEVERVHFDYQQAVRAPKHWNFAPWADFRSYMDLSLANALDQLRQVSHDLDPSTPVGIEGTQMPHAFGGYDLWRLSRAVDWVEPYDIACAREILGSFMPNQPLLTTVFESKTLPAARRLWHLLLEGDRGCLVWWSEDCIDWHSPDWHLTAKAKALQPVLHELTSPLARIFLLARREKDPIFIHYSQPSIQADWLLESTVDGSTWLRRFSSFEAEHNRMAKARTAWLKALQDLSYSPSFLSSEQLEHGAVAGLSNVVLVLVNSWALSQAELTQLDLQLSTNATVSGHHQVFTEGPAGVFDAHGKLRPPRNRDNLISNSIKDACVALSSDENVKTTPLSSVGYLSERLKAAEDSAWLTWLKEQLKHSPPEIAVPSQAHARVHRFHTRLGRLLAIERNVVYQMSEDLRQAGGNEALERPLATEAILRTPAHVYDLRSERYLGWTNKIEFTLDPWRPSLFALLKEKLPAQTVIAELSKLPAESTSD